MNKVRTRNIKVNTFKNINDLECIFGDNNQICIYGENGVGKTNFLESLVTTSYHKIQKEFSKRIVELTLDIELDEKSDLYKVLKNHKLGVTCIVEDDRYAYEIKTIKGVDEFVNEIEENLKVNESIFREKITEYLNMLDEFKNLRDKVFDAEYYNPKFHNDFFNFDKHKKEQLNELIEGLESFLIKDRNFEINRTDLTFPQFDYWYRHNIHIFTDTYISLERYNEFKERYKDCTLDLHGLEIDFDSIDKKVQQANKSYKEVMAIINSHLERYRSTYTEDTAESIYDILNQVNFVRNEINKIITTYVNSFKYLPNNLEKYGMHHSRTNNEEYETILSIVGVSFDEKQEYRTLSDGEKWIKQFVSEISTFENCLVLIDEPAVFLNPALQKNILNVFDYLELKGCQIMYTTHSHFLLDFSQKINTLKLTNPHKPKFDKLVINDNYLIDNVQLGELLMLSTKQIVLVEGICDKVLFEKILQKMLVINLSNIAIFDCNGDGIIPILDFCITSNIDFKAIIDNDKHEDIIQVIGEERLDKISKRVKFVGSKNSKGKLEDLLTVTDKEILCLPSPKKHHNKELHLDHGMIKDAFNSELFKSVSKRLVDEVERIFKDLQIII